MSGRNRSARRALRRWSWRLYRQEWRQQVLVLALISFAVAVAVFGATAAYNLTSTCDGRFGSASHRFESSVTDPGAIPRYEAAAAEWFGTVEIIGHQQVAVPGSAAVVELRSAASDGAFSTDMVDVRSGRRPSAPGEVAITDGVRAELGAEIGDEVELGRSSYEVVGIVENPADLDDEFADVLPGDVPPDSVTLLVHAPEDLARTFRPPVEPGPGFLEARGANERTTAAVSVLMVAVVAMVLVGLVSGASFITLAHRRMRQLGMLAAVGATPRHLRRAVMMNGTAVGATAGVVGTVVGLLAWLATASAFEPAAAHRINPWNVPLWTPAAGIVLAVGTATVAAWWPARAVARVPITDAVAARPPRPSRVRRSLAGALLLLVGGVLAIGAGLDPRADEMIPMLFIPGVIALVAGILLSSAPALRAVARTAGRLPVGTRLAVRDLARFEARSAAALGAITLGLAIATSVVVIAAANVPGADEGNLAADQFVVWTASPGEFGGLQVPALTQDDIDRHESELARILEALPGATVTPLDVAVDPTTTQVDGGEELLSTAVLGRPVNEHTLRDAGLIFVATPQLLDHLGVDDLASNAILATTQQGDVYITGNLNQATFVRDGVPSDRVERIDVPDLSSAPRTLITEAGLEAAGLEPMRAGWAVDLDAPLSPAELRAARDLAADAGLAIEVRDQHGGLTVVRTVATVAGILVALSILALTAGLLRSEAGPERRTLEATGATRRTRRVIAASTCGVLALVGAGLALVTTYAAIVAGYWPDTDRLSTVPVAHLAALLLGLPAIAALLAWLLGGRDDPDLLRS